MMLISFLHRHRLIFSILNAFLQIQNWGVKATAPSTKLTKLNLFSNKGATNGAEFVSFSVDGCHTDEGEVRWREKKLKECMALCESDQDNKEDQSLYNRILQQCDNLLTSISNFQKGDEPVLNVVVNEANVESDADDGSQLWKQSPGLYKRYKN